VRALTENELDMLVLVLLLLSVIAAMNGMMPQLAQIFPSLMGGMFRVMDIIKDKVPMLSYI
jgi:hypothetical protein